MFAVGQRVTVLGSPSGSYDGKIGTVLRGRAVVTVEFDDGRVATFWHEDLRAT